jgi:hypothetical protein
MNCICCLKELSSKQALQRHQDVCKKYIEQNTREQYEKQIHVLKEQYERQINEQKEQYEKQIQTQQNQISKLESQIFEMAKQPKTQKTFNLIKNLSVFDLTTEKTKQYAKDNFTEEVFFRKKSLEQLFENLLTDPVSKKNKVICTDVSRKTFKIKTESGEIMNIKSETLQEIVVIPFLDANRQMIRKLINEKYTDSKTRDEFKKSEVYYNKNEKDIEDFFRCIKRYNSI